MGVGLLGLALLGDEMWRQADCFGTCVATDYWLAYRYAPFLEAAIVGVLVVILRSLGASMLVSVWSAVAVLTAFVLVDFFAGADAVFSIV
jgi:hypothetical protein